MPLLSLPSQKPSVELMVTVWTEIDQVFWSIDLREECCLREVLDGLDMASLYKKRVTTSLALPLAFFHYRGGMCVDRPAADIAFTASRDLCLKSLPALLAKLTIFRTLLRYLAAVCTNTIFTVAFRVFCIMKRVRARPRAEKPPSDFLKALRWLW
jgi:hypothetical protein